MFDLIIVAYVQCHNADSIKESAKSTIKVFVCQVYHSPIGMNHTKKCRWVL